MQTIPRTSCCTAAMAAVVTPWDVRVVAAGIGVPAWRGEAIRDALAEIGPGRAVWLAAVEHRTDRRQPVVRLVRQLRAGTGTPQEAARALLEAFYGPPAPDWPAPRRRPTARPRKPPARPSHSSVPDAPAGLPRSLWASWLRWRTRAADRADER